MKKSWYGVLTWFTGIVCGIGIGLGVKMLAMVAFMCYILIVGFFLNE